MIHEFDFGFGAKVYIDEDPSIVALVIGIQLQSNNRERYCVAWWSESKHVEEWIDGWRLTGV